MKIDALGFLEVRGLVAAIEAADAMAKAADVRLIRQHQVDPRFITLVVEGDLSACRAAVDAGKAAAARLGEVVSRLEIGRPDADTEWMVVDLVGRSKEDKKPGKKQAARPVARKTPGTPTPGASGAPPTPTRDDPPAAAAASAVPPSSPAVQPAPSPVAGGETPHHAAPGDEDLLAFIAAAPRGRTLTELKTRFGAALDKARLEALVAGGRLRKAGARYRIPGA
ncbi:BMC domain-containing protein [Pseudothauera nasutitermitis]|uniref:BMC domain-containing protein n=1 Tax=Pseudothauera nasutitermitis TaxID=2565930 RepID=A0A4V3WCF6_9RHOO|nr:BMC domain-containing protein [Pseudothauera nasutitermitis]THF67014.1 BMC domain-containing protein [Pseudothauera nasutitermitis]